jgi:hypothetical protein
MWTEIASILERSAHSERDREASRAALAAEQNDLVITGSSHAALLFSSVSPTVAESDVITLSELLLTQYVEGDEDLFLKIRTITEDMTIDATGAAWEQGYELAEEVFERLAPTGDFVDVEAILRSLDVTLRSVSLTDPLIRGCSLVGPRHRPTVAVNDTSHFNSERARRFTLAHELCHLLFDRSQGAKLAIASGPWAPRAVEKRANAFAAMLLMPARLVETAIADSPDPIVELPGIKRVADRLQVGLSTTINHLFNLTLMTEEDRDGLLAAAERRT